MPTEYPLNQKFRAQLGCQGSNRAEPIYAASMHATYHLLGIRLCLGQLGCQGYHGKRCMPNELYLDFFPIAFLYIMQQAFAAGHGLLPA